MIKEIRIRVWPNEVEDHDLHRKKIAKATGIPPEELSIHLRKRSIDARKMVQYELIYEYTKGSGDFARVKGDYTYKNIKSAKPVLIVGAGPAGLFAALRLIELGLKPIIIERGKDVRERRRDLKAINRDHKVNPDSNYCFGEGGAGTYSDGKLYTRSGKRGSIQRILEILHLHGAREEILIDAHPHIGTNKLPKLVSDLSQTILNAGGEIHFNTALDSLKFKEGKITGARFRNGESIDLDAIILATGHSARDIFFGLHDQGIRLEAKPFAMGVRAEHHQNLIDQIQYKKNERGAYLPAASYKLVHQVKKRGVYSFCMCPGGFIVPSATQEKEIVVNGMSPSKRDSPFANSGIVVELHPQDLGNPEDPLVGLRYQMKLESMAWKAGGGGQTAPAQRITDFVQGKISNSLLETSYQPGLNSAPLHDILPPLIGKTLQEGFRAFGKKMRGYYTQEAQILGIESRTSSPVRIPRDPKTGMHPELKGLFPCGEGAGFAGGIVSAAIDGEKMAEHAAEFLK